MKHHAKILRKKTKVVLESTLAYFTPVAKVTKVDNAYPEKFGYDIAFYLFTSQKYAKF